MGIRIKVIKGERASCFHFLKNKTCILFLFFFCFSLKFCNMVGKRHIKPSVFVKLKMMNHGIPTVSLKKLYWDNPEAQRGLESNFKNWQAYYRGQKLKKGSCVSKPISLPKHQNKKFLHQKEKNQPKNTKQFTKKKDARTQTRMKGIDNKSRKWLKAVKAPAIVGKNQPKSSEIVDYQGLKCPEQSTSTWPAPTHSGHVDVPLYSTNFQRSDPFEWNASQSDMSECNSSDYTQKNEPKSEPQMKYEYEYNPPCEPVSPYRSGEGSSDIIKQSLVDAKIEIYSEVKSAPIAVQFRPLAKVEPMQVESDTSDPVVVGPAERDDVFADPLREAVGVVAPEVRVEEIADPIREIIPDVGEDIGVDAIADLEPAQIGVVEADPEMVARPAMVAEPVVVGPAAVWNVGVDDPEIILMDQGDSDIEFLGEFVNPRQKRLKTQLHHRQLTRQRQGGYHEPRYKSQRKGRKY